MTCARCGRRLRDGEVYSRFTKKAFVPARSLYASAGFVPSEPFGGYTATSDNVFMTRLLG